MKIYTKKGDKGQTSLFGGAPIEKFNERLHAYGTVDELSSVLGMVLAQNAGEAVRQMLFTIQEDLFVLGADLATLQKKQAKISRIAESHTLRLEQWIDQLEESLPPLTSFILPGGSKPGSTLHFARTVCRRAERHTTALMQLDEMNEQALVYLNRLSDLLFVMARYENQQNKCPETPWQPRKKTNRNN